MANSKHVWTPSCAALTRADQPGAGRSLQRWQPCLRGQPLEHVGVLLVQHRLELPDHGGRHARHLALRPHALHTQRAATRQSVGGWLRASLHPCGRHDGAAGPCGCCCCCCCMDLPCLPMSLLPRDISWLTRVAAGSFRSCQGLSAHSLTHGMSGTHNQQVQLQEASLPAAVQHAVHELRGGEGRGSTDCLPTCRCACSPRALRLMQTEQCAVGKERRMPCILTALRSSSCWASPACSLLAARGSAAS